MFKTLFKRNASVDIDRLIFELAEYERSADFEVFCDLIAGREFYLRVDPASMKRLPRGVTYQTKSTDSVKVSTATIEGLTLVGLFTTCDDKRLRGSYVGIEGLEGLRMVMKCTGADGVLFQNKEDSWVVLTTDAIKQVLAKYPEQ
jgi:hypothetical protein